MKPISWPDEWPDIPAEFKPRSNGADSIRVDAVVDVTFGDGATLTAAVWSIDGLLPPDEDNPDAPDTWRWWGERSHYVVGPPTVDSDPFATHRWSWANPDGSATTRMRSRVPGDPEAVEPD